VSELAPNGELFDFVSEVDSLGGSKVKYARSLFRQCVEGVQYLHQKGIAHRDLKLENCFLDSKCDIKIADFGLMKIFANGNSNLETTLGTPNYMAPEIRAGKYNGEQTDIFALGVMLFMILTCQEPFTEASEKNKHWLRWCQDPERVVASRKLNIS